MWWEVGIDVTFLCGGAVISACWSGRWRREPLTWPSIKTGSFFPLLYLLVFLGVKTGPSVTLGGKQTGTRLFYVGFHTKAYPKRTTLTTVHYKKSHMSTNGRCSMYGFGKKSGKASRFFCFFALYNTIATYSRCWLVLVSWTVFGCIYHLS